MLRTTITLIGKKVLTHDVYELTYSCPELTKEPPKPGQYVMFQLAPGLSRAYSIAAFQIGQDFSSSLPETVGLTRNDGNTFTLIIKRVPDGKGSPLICDAEIGTVHNAMIPLGHFTLRDTPRSKCFIGTGTGFAPLYCQLMNLSEKENHIAFIFGVRSFADSFYESEIATLGKQFRNFEYVQYFSREESLGGADSPKVQGYVTDWINAESVSRYEEYYVCGSPVMVKSAREKLEALGVAKEDIYWEQF